SMSQGYNVSRRPFSATLFVVALLPLAACNDGGSSGLKASGPSLAATPAASCGPGSQPEIGIQGRVSRAEFDSGRAAHGYTCNTEVVGSYIVPNAVGTVAGFKVERYVDA